MAAEKKRLERLDKKYVWHPFTQMSEWESEDQLIIERGKGNYLIDTDGNRYIDGVSSMWVNVHGHGKKEINAAVNAQLKKIAHSTLLGLGSTPSIELAKRLVDITPKGLSRVFYSDNGSTAVEIALKIAFQYQEQTRRNNRKKKFIAFTGAYHGDTFGSMSVGEIDIFVKKYRPLLFDTIRAPYPYCYRCPSGKSIAECKTACLDDFETLLKRHHKDLAACVIEPVFEGAAGMIVAPKGFLKEVRRLTRKYDVLLIADEVATGFGRTGRYFACDTEGVSPDILCLAKGLTGGYLPLAATLTTEKIYKAFLGRYDEYKAFFHGHTYTGNALGCAAAIANLDIFEREAIIKGLRPKIRLLKRLSAGFNALAHAGDVRHVGLVAAIELVRDKETKEPYQAKERIGHRVCMEARKGGLIIRPLGDTITIIPPLSITEAEIEKIAAIIHSAIKKITG
ncbi:MAG: adenosylmethionine--8-amino-7-oxononanoate transaminase [Deltaproteobacteria bacterium]